MDFYYDEAQMNKWRDSCKKGNENIKKKVDSFEKESAAIRSRYPSSPVSYLTFDEKKCKDLQKRLEAIVHEKEPLIISIISTVYEDLKEIHKQLGVFCAVDPKPDEVRYAQQFFMNADKLKLKLRTH